MSASVQLNPKSTAHIAKARKFEAQRDAGGLTAEWQVVLHFYTALHWVTAVCAHRRQAKRAADPRFPKVKLDSHAQIEKALPLLDVPESVQDEYADLRDISEWARYGTTPEKEITPDVIAKALRLDVSIIGWAKGELIAAGYTC